MFLFELIKAIIFGIVVGLQNGCQSQVRVT